MSSKCYICDQSTLNEILLTCCQQCQQFQCHQECFKDIYEDVFRICPVCKNRLPTDNILQCKLVWNDHSRLAKYRRIHNKLLNISGNFFGFGRTAVVFLARTGEMCDNRHIIAEISYLQSEIRKLLLTKTN